MSKLTKAQDQLKWILWRLTGYRKLTKMLHTKVYGGLTRVGLDELTELAEKERELWNRKTFGFYMRIENLHDQTN